MMEAVGTAIGGGLSAGALLLLILRLLDKRQDRLENRQDAYEKANQKDHKTIKKAAKKFEDCVEGELQNINLKQDRMINFLIMTTDNEKAVDVLKNGRSSAGGSKHD